MSKLEKKRAEFHCIYGFVLGVRAAVPSVSIRQAVEMYKTRFDPDEEEDTDNLTSIYNRMQQLYKSELSRKRFKIEPQ